MDGDDEAVMLTCQAADGTRQDFKIKKTTKLRKLIEAYCEATGAAGRGGMRFLFDGQSIGDHDTADGLGIESGDVIDIMKAQHGG